MSGNTFYYPDTACLIGPDWWVTVAGNTTLNGDLVTACNVVEATVTETVDSVAVFLANVALPNTGQGSGWDVEVYDATDLPARAVTTLIYRPTEDVRNVDAWAWGSFSPGGTQTNIYRGIDSASLTPGTWPNTGQPVDNDEFVFPVFGTGYECTFRFDADVAVDPVGKHITRVGLAARIQEYVDLAFVAGMTITPYLNIAGVRYFGPTFTVNGESPGGHVVTADWYANPATRSAWRVDDVAEFADTTGADSAGWIVRPTGSANNLATILQGWLEVDHTDDAADKRLAIGSLTDPVVGWNEVTLAEPDGTPGWSKVAGGLYAVIVRRRSGEGAVGMRYLDSGDPPPANVEGSTVTVDGSSFVPVALPDAETRTWAMALVVGAGVSVDSQPYASINGDAWPALGLDGEVNVVDAAGGIEQTFTPVATDDFPFLRALVRWSSTEPADDLTVDVVRTSDSTLMGTWTVTAADLVTPQTRWQIAEVLIAPAPTLAVGVEYRYEVTSPASVEGAGWEVQILSGLERNPGTDPANPPPGLGDASWTGEVGEVSVDAVAYPASDACLVLYTETDPPTNLAAAATAEVDGIAYVDVTWTNPVGVDCGGIDYVEVQRRETVDTTWRLVARVDGESWRDAEARRNVTSDYRARVRRLDGAVSAWTSVDSAAPTLTECGLVFATNVDTTMAEWFDDVADGTTTFTPVTNAETRQFLGRPYAVEFAEDVDRGWQFDRTLLVGATHGATTGTPAPSTPAEAWARVLAFTQPEVESGTSLPYVCVLDRSGGRWFAAVRPEAAVRREPAGAYTVDVTVTELTRTPYPVDA